MQAGLVGCTVWRQVTADIEQIGNDLIILFGKHACHCQCVASIVPRSGKDHNGC